MPKLTRVSVVGNGLSLIIDDGRRVLCHPIPGNMFMPRVLLDVSAKTPGGGSGSGGDGGQVDPGDGTITVGPVPDSLSAKNANGETYTFGKAQLTHAANIIKSAAKIGNVTNDVVLIALITAITESVLWMYANTANYPSSANYPHDKDGQDHDSLGLYQQRPQFGWGTIAQLMDVEYSTRAFIGGPDGPNNGDPKGLFDISGWQSMTPGTAAQSVQNSQFPDRYDVNVPVARAIMAALIVSKPGGGSSGDWRWPFKYSEYVLPDPLAQFGMRVNPVTGVYTLHRGLDFGAAAVVGKDVTAAHAGTVTVNAVDGRGFNVTVQHAEEKWHTNYFHMIEGSIVVNTGDKVAPGDKLGIVGSTGNSTGTHLHWETHENGEPVNPRDFMKARGVPES